jgi:outer membrane immunogenic protein
VRVVIAGLISVATLASSAVNAADIPARMPTKAPAQIVAYRWTGCYLGVNAGYQATRAHFNDVATGTDVGSHTGDGALAGGQIGCDYQFGNWVVGVEGMFDWTNAKGDHTFNDGGSLNNPTTEMKWLATATARVGYAVDRNLVYVKGGGAWANTDLNLPVTAPGAAVFLEANNTWSGWTVGAGWEYAFAPGWSAKVEYNYLDLGSRRPTSCVTSSNVAAFPVGACLPVFDIDMTSHMVLVGLNYRFSGPR